ncbi:MAG: endonuclease III [Fidelibacterota bacterium]
MKSDLRLETEQQIKDRMKQVIQRLRKGYPDAQGTLTHSSPHELLVSTILSAQCTDKRVDMVTATLFKKYRTVRDFAFADVHELAQDIRTCGYYNQKARSIKGASLIIWEEHGGKVPRTMDQLVKLPGVGRKTASCVLGTAFGIPSVAIDTHMIRILGLLGFTDSKDPEKIEQDVMDIAPVNDWIDLTHLVIEHGREICIARRPRCGECSLNDICPSALVSGSR